MNWLIRYLLALFGAPIVVHSLMLYTGQTHARSAFWAIMASAVFGTVVLRLQVRAHQMREKERKEHTRTLWTPRR